MGGAAFFEATAWQEACRVSKASPEEVHALQSFLDERNIHSFKDITEDVLAAAEEKLPSNRHNLIRALRRPCRNDSQQQQQQQGSRVTASSICLVTTHMAVGEWLRAPDRMQALGEAVRAHMKDTGKDTRDIRNALPRAQEAYLPARCTPNQWHDLFPEDPQATSHAAKEEANRQSIEVEYNRYSGGFDVLGKWQVAPLGCLVRYAFVKLVSAELVQHEPDVEVHLDAQAPKLESARNVKGELHKLKRFVYYYSPKHKVWGGKALGLLDPEVMEDGIQRAQKKIKNEKLYKTVRESFSPFASPSMPSDRGLLLYGPPGTGKTTIARSLASDLGMTSLCGGGIAAGELRAGLQGGIEKRVKTLFMRGNACPWLLCSVLVDEAETLALDRGSVSGREDHGHQSVLCHYFGGGNDVRNTFFFGATNWMQKMDQAFLRRTMMLAFVGLPTACERMNWPFTKIVDDERVRTDSCISDAVKRHFGIMTTNMSGANMDRVMMIIQRMKVADITEEVVAKAAEQVADEQRVGFGNTTIPRLLQQQQAQGAKAYLEAGIEDNFIPLVCDKMGLWTGRMFLNLTENAIDTHHGPYLDVEYGEQRLWTFRQQHVKMGMHSKKDTVGKDFFLRLLLQLGQALDANTVQMVSNSECSEDESLLFLNSVLEQCRKYHRSIVILDLDSAILGGDPTDPARQNVNYERLLKKMFDTSREARCEVERDSFMFVVCMTTHECLAKRFESRASWGSNALRQYFIEQSGQHQCTTCWEVAVPLLSGKACKQHDPGAMFSRDGQVPKSRSAIMKEQVTEQMKWHWSCCGQPGNILTCTNPKYWQPHEFGNLVPPVRCSKQHSVPNLENMGLERVWCNACSVPVAAKPAADAPKACHSCKVEKGCLGSRQGIPVWVPRAGVCPRCDTDDTLRMNHRQLVRETKLCLEAAQRRNLWWIEDTRLGRWERVDDAQVAWWHMQMVHALKSDMKKGTVKLPWSPEYPNSARMYYDGSVFNKLRTRGCRKVEIWTFDEVHEKKVAAGETPFAPGPPSLNSRKYMYVVPQFGIRYKRCRDGARCTHTDPFHFAEQLHPAKTPLTI
eukprot:Sspe_Gene.21952::Locus_8266_Transcript_2_3_Confidence_0.400_Length_3639::g.21952::m.21952